MTECMLKADFAWFLYCGPFSACWIAKKKIHTRRKNIFFWFCDVIYLPTNPWKCWVFQFLRGRCCSIVQDSFLLGHQTFSRRMSLQTEAGWYILHTVYYLHFSPNTFFFLLHFMLRLAKGSGTTLWPCYLGGHFNYFTYQIIKNFSSSSGRWPCYLGARPTLTILHVKEFLNFVQPFLWFALLWEVIPIIIS